MGGGVSGGALAQTCPAAPAAVPPTCTPASPPRSSTHPLARACQPTALKTPRGWPTTPSLPARVCTGPLTPLAACASFLILTLACVQLLALAPPPCMVLRSGSCPIGAQPPPHCVPCAPPPHCTTTCTSPYHPAHTQPSAQQQGKPVRGGRDGGWGACARAGGGGAVPPARPASLSLSLQAAPPCLHHPSTTSTPLTRAACPGTRAQAGGGRTASPPSASPAHP